MAQRSIDRRSERRFELEVIQTADRLDVDALLVSVAPDIERNGRARRAARLSLEDLGRLGVVMKRAVYFVTAGGRYGGLKKDSAEAIKTRLLEKKEPAAVQPQLFAAAEPAGEL